MFLKVSVIMLILLKIFPIFAAEIVPHNKLQSIMEIKVYLSFENYNRRKTCYCNRIDVASGMEVDFGLLLRSMRVLYGKNCIVEFLIVS